MSGETRFVMTAGEERAARSAIAQAAPWADMQDTLNRVRKGLYKWQGATNAADWARSSMISRSLYDVLAKPSLIEPNLFGVSHP